MLGIDIVGFEHAAETDEQKTAVERAEAILAEPLALFAPSPAAGCRVAPAAVQRVTEEHDPEEDAKAATNNEATHAGDEAEHAEFRAEYVLDCSDPAELRSLVFAFFERFPNAEEVAVTLLTARGQTSYEVTRASPRLVVDGLS